MIAKAGLGLIGLSAISVGGVALSKPHLLGMDYMPEWHSLSEDSNFSTEHNETNKLGKKYGKYLVGSNNKAGAATQHTNEAWWEWSFRRIDKGKLDKGKFKTLKLENSNGAALKKLCEEAYKKAPNDLKNDSDSSITDSDFKKSDVWKYCSPGKLTTTSADKGANEYKTTEIGGESDNKTKLISVKNSANDWFWEKRNADFLGTGSDWSGSKATDGSSFKTAYDNKDKTGEPKKTIKQLCEDAYALTKSSNTNEDTDAKKFCKLEA